VCNGFDKRLPLSLQIVGRCFDEATFCGSVKAAYGAGTPWPRNGRPQRQCPSLNRHLSESRDQMCAAGSP